MGGGLQERKKGWDEGEGLGWEMDERVENYLNIYEGLIIIGCMVSAVGWEKRSKGRKMVKRERR